MANVSMYKSDGQTFEVSDDRLEDFLEQYPNATKVEEKAPDLSKKVEMYYVKDGDKYTPYEVSGDKVEDFKARYREGKGGDVEVKKDLAVSINNFLCPIREKRDYYEKNPKLVEEALMSGTNNARKIANETMKMVRSAMKIDSYTSKW